MTTDPPDAITRVDAALDRPTLSHARALKALAETDGGLPYRELARELNLSGRQTRRVIADLEAADLVEREPAPRGVPEAHRFTDVNGRGRT